MKIIINDSSNHRRNEIMAAMKERNNVNENNENGENKA